MKGGGGWWVSASLPPLGLLHHFTSLGRLRGASSPEANATTASAAARRARAASARRVSAAASFTLTTSLDPLSQRSCSSSPNVVWGRLWHKGGLIPSCHEVKQEVLFLLVFICQLSKFCLTLSEVMSDDRWMEDADTG